MPATKPIQITGETGVPVVRRARQSAAGNRNAMNAALGTDNFARLLKNDPQTAVNSIKSQQNDRAQGLNLKQAYPGMDMSLNNKAEAYKLQEMTRAQKALQQSTNPLSLVNSLNSLQSARLEGQEAALLALRTNSHKTRNATDTDNKAKKPVETPAESAGTEFNKKIGQISALFESGKEGISAIGYDRVGGTSYGQYQIASKTGTMDNFIAFLSEKATDFATRLKQAGAGNTGSKQGQMPKVWKELAAEAPERFAALQKEFISKTHFEPTLAKIKELTGLDANKLSEGVREAIFSTAVQHGAGSAGRIVARALDAVGLSKLTSNNPKENQAAEQKLVRDIYQNRSGQFVSSGESVRESVQNRLKSEMNMVLNLLKNNGKNLG
ncbi:MAG: hypothetical protein LBV76_03855 [Deltaproteobacteria bacterium]|nr:hypothetical protein [Deltaproteobacteria bacterium]